MSDQPYRNGNDQDGLETHSGWFEIQWWRVSYRHGDDRKYGPWRATRKEAREWAHTTRRVTPAMLKTVHYEATVVGAMTEDVAEVLMRGENTQSMIGERLKLPDRARGADCGRYSGCYEPEYGVSELYEVSKRTRIRDGAPQNQAKCPGCGQWADVDAEQWRGDVSLICPDCGWHGYIRGETPLPRERAD